MQIIINYCELFGGPFDGFKYTDNNFQQSKFMLTPNGKYAIYSLISGKWDHTKSAHFNKLQFTGYKRAI